jgi:hypothetical protein
VLVIIPAYNESATITDVIAAIRQRHAGFDVVVIDDGSKDDTARIVLQTPGADLVRLPYNLGIGGAMQTGYKYALREGYDVAIQCDADGQHPVDQMDRILAPLLDGRADLVVGSRYVKNTGYRPSFSRRVGKSLLSRIVNVFCGGGITDTTSGFRAANRKVIALFAHVYPDDYPEAEALVTLHRHGLKACEVSVDMLPRQGGRSSISPRRAAYYIVKVSLAIFISTVRDITRTPRSAFEPVEPAPDSAEPEARLAKTALKKAS